MSNKLTFFDEEGLNGVNTLFDDLFNAPFRSMRPLNKIVTDVKETEKEYCLEMELPGVEKQNIDINLKEGTLTISVSKEDKTSVENEKSGYIRRERRFGSYSRSFYVGTDVNENEISASLENGVLNVIVPKKEPEKPKVTKITIK